MRCEIEQCQTRIIIKIKVYFINLIPVDTHLRFWPIFHQIFWTSHVTFGIFIEIFRGRWSRSKSKRLAVVLFFLCLFCFRMRINKYRLLLLFFRFRLSPLGGGLGEWAVRRGRRWPLLTIRYSINFILVSTTKIWDCLLFFKKSFQIRIRVQCWCNWTQY